MNVFTKRCGCGRILKLRESCPTCAERARAELHARGVASKEATPCFLCGALTVHNLCDSCESLRAQYEGLHQANSVLRGERREPPPMPIPCGLGQTDGERVTYRRWPLRRS